MDTTSAVTNDEDLFVSQMKRRYVMYVAGRDFQEALDSWQAIVLLFMH